MREVDVGSRRVDCENIGTRNENEVEHVMFVPYLLRPTQHICPSYVCCRMKLYPFKVTSDVPFSTTPPPRKPPTFTPPFIFIKEKKTVNEMEADSWYYTHPCMNCVCAALKKNNMPIICWKCVVSRSSRWSSVGI